ncbi:lytic transglycosylase domain-containing protein [Clostridium butyricum]|uniref:lytic transglycosylase domain-containing protein n=1 Tax=Clostridium TaxID=1485 RepID=UPI00071B9A65|nr:MULTISPECIES: lytic transglycosylase domain-containing protein [Clostridium]ALP89212.1 lytic transglycosylase [Clostridium butyricum]ALS15676.1 lytic transglycosylase [Clostridium butyricum]ANF12826.1 lytic transglycosylase [Clostridium butyricum]AOR92895.1 lytic transglycosylase [Clostridium butyricum]MCI3007013.1 lytic transglycosylase domain-containing protein [Clostridium butyricum]
MPIDGLSNNISNEQLMAMSLMSNGQLTNESTSSTESSEYNNLAFQMMMKNYMDSAQNTAKDNVDKIVNNSNTENNNSTTEVKKQTDASDSINAAAASNQTSRAVQNYLAGQKLTDIPLTLNNSYGNIYSSGTSMLNNRTPEDLKKIYSAVSDASKKYGISESLILAVIKQESDFDSTCTSSVGASGLMQIMPGNYSHLGISNPYDVDQNVNGGTKLLREYLDKYNGDIQMALMAYNGGPGTMQRRGVTSSDDLYKMPEETQNYVPKVMGYYQSGV